MAPDGLPRALGGIMFLGVFLNAFLAGVLYLRSIGVEFMPGYVYLQVRFYLFLGFGAILAVGATFLRKDRARASIRNQAPITEDPDPRDLARWHVIEALFLVNVGALTILQVLRFNPFFPLISFGAARESITSNSLLCQALDRWMEVTFLLLCGYATVKIPMATRRILAVADRCYLGRWRIHESVFGIAWVLIGAAFALYGWDIFNQGVGIVYIIFGGFLVGRDYQDVGRLAFIQEVPTST